MTKRLPPAASLAALLLLAACGGGEDAGGGDNQLIAEANNADPALTGALEDQIMVDPSLSQQSNANSARPSSGPIQAPVPSTGGATAATAAGAKDLLSAPAPKAGAAQGELTLGELAQLQARGSSRCDFNVAYSAGWANRLPATFPLYPDAQVTEAAGKDVPGCKLRVVSFTSAAPLQTMVDYYYTKAVRAGFSAEHQKGGAEHVLAGSQEKGDGAFFAFIRPTANGSEVDFVTNQGR